ncbi:MAG: DUF2935 domain-containing protein [Defluviitaleaceae bacterium]|nr:DUF2935 domain-containing protein [Defluviitaleaceae bacterium]
MRFYYGEQNVLRALDEAEFWKHQEAEHTGVIPLVLPNLEYDYKAALEEYGIEFNKMLAEVTRYVESAVRSKGIVGRVMRMEMLDLIKRCVKQSSEFTEFLEDMLRNSSAARASAPSQELINHMIRESNYFIGIGTLIMS